MDYLPMFARLEGRPVLLVGGARLPCARRACCWRQVPGSPWSLPCSSPSSMNLPVASPMWRRVSTRPTWQGRSWWWPRPTISRSTPWSTRAPPSAVCSSTWWMTPSAPALSSPPSSIAAPSWWPSPAAARPRAGASVARAAREPAAPPPRRSGGALRPGAPPGQAGAGLPLRSPPLLGARLCLQHPGRSD